MLVLALTACGGGDDDATPTPSPTERPTPTASPTPSPTPAPVFNEFGVRYCAYTPGESEPAEMPRSVTNPPSRTPFPTATLPAQTAVAPEITERQLSVLELVDEVVTETYVSPDYNGRDWPGIVDRDRAVVAGGLSDEDYYVVMDLLIRELGDEHSHFMSPEDVIEDEKENNEGSSFVGIGTLVQRNLDTQTADIIAVYPNSPAAEAGLRPHDVLLEVDGLPFYDPETNTPRTVGPEGTTFSLTFRHVGEEPQTIEITRRAVSGFTPVEYCIVPGTRIGYIMIPNLLETNIDDQVRDALYLMTADGPLDGLVLDNRLNDGGASDVLEPMLGFFTSGVQGQFVSRTEERDLVITAEDIGGSQTVPLVILSDRGAASYGELFTGVLQTSGRATVIGAPTEGNVETLTGTNFFADNSKLWLAAETFRPIGLEAGVWEGAGITPDVSLPTQWNLFSEATDPALAEAVELVLD